MNLARVLPPITAIIGCAFIFGALYPFRPGTSINVMSAAAGVLFLIAAFAQYRAAPRRQKTTTDPRVPASRKDQTPR